MEQRSKVFDEGARFREKKQGGESVDAEVELYVVRSGWVVAGSRPRLLFDRKHLFHRESSPKSKVSKWVYRLRRGGCLRNWRLG